MTQEHPLVERYLQRLQDGLKTMREVDRGEVVSDIRSHIAEATAAGTPLESVLSTLGPADALARAYAVELLLNPAPGRPAITGIERYLSLAGILALTSLPTFLIVVTLGSIGIAFLASGVAVLVAGIAELVGVVPPFMNGDQMEVHPALAVAVGPVLAVVGVVALLGLWKYLRWLAGTVSDALPKK
jgi:uncharacterized membrane protein